MENQENYSGDLDELLETQTEGEEGAAKDSPGETDASEAKGNEPEQKPEAPKKKVLIGQEELDEEVAIQAIQDHKNNEKWKQKNEERGRILNEKEKALEDALKLQERLEKDERFKQHVNSFEEERLVQIKEEVGDDELAQKIFVLERENRDLKQKTMQEKIETAYSQEEKQLLAEGASEDELVQAYDIVNELNPAYFAKHGKPVALTDAMGVLATRSGGLKGITERIEKKVRDKIMAEMRQQGKASLPVSIPGNGAVPVKTKYEPADSDEATEALFNTPEFAHFKDRP